MADEVLRAGAALAGARGAVVLLHGRGATAEDILGLGLAFGLDGVALLAPQAPGRSWYPYSFMAPRAQNEPFCSEALRTVERTMALARAAGLGTERIAVCGFSQGACLSSEFVATHPARYAAVVGFTGGLIGAELGQYGGDLAGTPVFLGSGDPDAHVPWTRVVETAEVLRGMRAEVETRRYPGRSHTVSQQELEVGRALLVEAFRDAHKV